MSSTKSSHKGRIGLIQNRLSRRTPLPRTRPVMPTSAKGIGVLTSDVMMPMRERRAGMFANIAAAWPEIVGEALASFTEPVRLDWPKRVDEVDSFEPAILVIAADPARALFVEAEATKWREKVNQFIGFHAVSRLKIEQRMGAGLNSKLLDSKKTKREELKPNPAQRAAIEDKLAAFDEGPLKQALLKLGVARLAARNRSRTKN